VSNFLSTSCCNHFPQQAFALSYFEMLSSRINDTKDVESSYPLISEDEESNSTVEEEEKTFAHRPTIIASGNLWKSLFIALLSINLLFLLIFILHVDHVRRPLLISQGLFPKSTRPNWMLLELMLINFQFQHMFSHSPRTTDSMLIHFQKKGMSGTT